MRLINYTAVLVAVILYFPCNIMYGQGARFTGSYIKSAAIQHIRKSNFVIEGLEITQGNRYLIVLYSCENVIIRNNKFGPSPARLAVYLDNCKNITITDNTFENIQTGLVAHNSQGIRFEYNDVTNVTGTLAGGSRTGNMVIFDKVSGAGNSISYNVCENFPGESSPEDVINVNQSDGTPSSPIMVKGNWIRGGGPSPSGGGIILGDVGGSYQRAEDNILVDVGQYGMSIAGGHNITLRNNKIYGRWQYFTNVGLYAINWNENLGKSYNMTVTGNVVNYTNKDGTLNNWWFAGNVEPVYGKESNRYDSALNASILPDKIIGRARSSSDSDEKTENQPGDNADTNNDPSVSIYIDKFGHICVNNRGPLDASANITARDESGKIVYQGALTRFHTVLPFRPAQGNYNIHVTNGGKTHRKILSIR